MSHPKLVYFQRQKNISNVSISPTVVWLLIFPVIIILDSICELFSEQRSAFAVLRKTHFVVEGLHTHFKGGFGDLKLNNTLIHLSIADVVLWWVKQDCSFHSETKCTTVMWVMFVETDDITALLWDPRGLHLWKIWLWKSILNCRLVNALGVWESLRLACIHMHLHHQQ